MSEKAIADPETVRLVLALHFHQPHGNMDAIFADAAERCYLPTLNLLGEHPAVRATIHVSGPLLAWCEHHCPQFIDRLASLVERQQVEILGGGDQEPMLAVLPDRDAVGQLEQLADRCQRLLGTRPTGMWLAERVWEPDLPRVIAGAGYRYTLLDDSHLHASGASEPLAAYYATDKADATIAIFPIARSLRERIPFGEVDELVTFLKSQAGRTLTYGDDAEKFGLWPTTEKRVWQQGWLKAFFEALEREAELIRTVTPSEELERQDSGGNVYIPTASYAEMGLWTLPPEQALILREFSGELSLAGMAAEAQTFVQGGIWQAFLAKYPESRLIHRKMLRVSAAVEEARLAESPNYPAARDALYQGQCNCAYWHGLFGGLYMQHLRSALMSALLKAEELIAPQKSVTVTANDHRGTLHDDLLFEGAALNAYLAPSEGARLFEIDLRQSCFHLTGVIARRREAYHVDVPRAQVLSDEELENISAHDLIRATEHGLVEKLIYDRHPRGAFVDHLLPATMTAEQFDRDYQAVADFAHHRYELRSLDGENSGRASATLRAHLGDYELTKRVSVANEGGIEVAYRLNREQTEPHARFASEIDFTLLSPDAVGGRSLTPLGPNGEKLSADPAPGARAEHATVSGLRIDGGDLGFSLMLHCQPHATLWRIPLETVSQSERGFERAYQGTALIFVWPAAAEGTSASEMTLSLSIVDAD